MRPAELNLPAGRTRRRPPAHPRLDLDRDGAHWPNREASRLVRAGGVRWHVQQMGTGPDVLLVHGTGASTHSFGALALELAGRFRVTACDLPGHGFTDRLPSARMTLPGMSDALADLLAALDVRPAVAVGHSAGAAILIRMCLDGRIAPRVVVSLNGALSGFRGPIGRFFSPLAQMLALNPLVPRVFARRARDPAVLANLVERTGSRLSPDQVALYGRLAADPDHVSAALAMMAGWDLGALQAGYARLKTPVVLVAGSRDGMVPADQVFDLERRIPHARAVVLRGLGHLAHEEAPEAIAAVIESAAREHGALPEAGP
ncbi:alpha/beta fold hydrolase BchO [Mongoliimonas terrestris]|uniref:alpha/beta fold hydrolase BchO n=1 Tax=Mongoliimonas terrestris TaxID=1709001 RepID=UPI000949893B|nr:alpha/beta fold hydrolase BchO [Mongoliimonas terrestris]